MRRLPYLTAHRRYAVVRRAGKPGRRIVVALEEPTWPPRSPNSGHRDFRSRCFEVGSDWLSDGWISPQRLSSSSVRGSAWPRAGCWYPASSGSASASGSPKPGWAWWPHWQPTRRRSRPRSPPSPTINRRSALESSSARTSSTWRPYSGLGAVVAGRIEPAPKGRRPRRDRCDGGRRGLSAERGRAISAGAGLALVLVVLVPYVALLGAHRSDPGPAWAAR